MANPTITRQKPAREGAVARKRRRRDVPSIPPGKIKLTYAEYAILPDDGKRYEIIEGDLDVNPAPTPCHQDVSRDLERKLLEALQDNGEGKVYDAPIDVVFDKHNIVQPDLIFIRADRLQIIGKKFIKGAPDLIVEILSPSSRRKDVLVKSNLYARFGVPSYWIVDPDIDRIEVFRLREGKYHLTLTANRPEVLEPEDFPGLKIPLDEIFP